MPSPTRVLFVVSEATPFLTTTDVADLVRQLPEQLQESRDYELRILMPRYGIISERKNRLHEVIRLSGAQVKMGGETETVKIKVASIPGIRLQVYFVESVAYFKRKGTFKARKTEEVFEDNALRSLFFGRAVLATIRNLGWSPDIVHAAGWAGALTPYVIRKEFSDDELIGNAKIVYTPDEQDALTTLDADTVALMSGDAAEGESLREVALRNADTVVRTPQIESDAPVVDAFDTAIDAVRPVYNELLGVDQ
jgi:starch synthase